MSLRCADTESLAAPLCRLIPIMPSPTRQIDWLHLDNGPHGECGVYSHSSACLNACLSRWRGDEREGESADYLTGTIF